MKKTKVGRYVLSLSEGEIKEFRDFLASPYFNKSKLVQRYFELVLKGVNGKKGDSEYIFKKLYPEEKFNQKKLSFLSSSLVNLMNRFFEINYSSHDNNGAWISRFSYLLYTGKYDLASIHAKSVPHFGGLNSTSRADYSYDLYARRMLMMYNFWRGQLGTHDDYAMCIEHLMKFYVAVFCELSVNLIQSHVVEEDLKSFCIEETSRIAKHPRFRSLMKDGVISLYIHATLLASEKISLDEYQLELKKWAPQLNAERLSFFISMRGTRLLRTYRKQPNPKILEKVYDHYDEYFALLRKSTLIDNIPTKIFLDVIEVLAGLENSSKLQSLWEVNIDFINKSDFHWVKKTFELHQALNQNDATTALDLLSDPEILITAIQRKCNQIRCFIDLEEFEAAENTIKTLRTYLSSNQVNAVLESATKHYLKVCSTILRVYKYHLGNESSKYEKEMAALDKLTAEKGIKSSHWLNTTIKKLELLD